jgi:hypothetical protein
MPNTGERGEITGGVNAKEAEVIQQSKLPFSRRYVLNVPGRKRFSRNGGLMAWRRRLRELNVESERPAQEAAQVSFPEL